jgi:hypothetical protein
MPSNTWPPPTSTWTPIATLLPEAAKETVLELFSMNGGCEFPCWWGITPGKTTRQEARNILQPLASDFYGIPTDKSFYDYPASYELFFQVPEDVSFEGLFGLMLSTDQTGIIQTIRPRRGWKINIYQYSLSNVLEKFGPPSEIWLKTDIYLQPSFELNLFYPHLGVNFGYTGLAIINNDVVQICPAEFIRPNPGVVLFNPDLGMETRIHS